MVKMENLSYGLAHREQYLKASPYTTLHSTVRGVGRCSSQTQQFFRLHSESKVQQQERVHDKSKATQKLPMKEQTKPLDIMLHTQMRAAKRAGFNNLVAAKMYIQERQKHLAERVQKIIEEEEVRSLRKEMIPRAQLMPFFNRPFFPQRSTRPLTVPKEPSFIRILNSKCCPPSNELDGFEKLRSKL
ncbi:protein TPX2-like isoform X2 [Macadamia integrifolia]|uniref:protein TPX2-like isoform X2 n=1 Tax=Macadamia integrifolia TaxID=60698 RepID=UPI001C4FBE96|nr:protein TPX2-like isoform X2 [Macadamia integrifolia]